MRLFLRWIPAIICMAIIFYASSQTHSQQDITPAISAIIPNSIASNNLSEINFIYGEATINISTMGVAGLIEFFIRKIAHFTIYAMLGFSVSFALRSKTLFNRLTVTVFLCVIYAASDEFHQRLTGGRTALFSDVIIDTIGSFFGATILIFIKLFKNRYKRNS
ncbi:VanZ family protein [Paenibacillus hamazuiensis]|uniref:VanZ family protein n=1 Tax=Paenibacillus hamazuiensis TaxID=2936508 RepID=UPI00200F785E|nr:VanZ family protein [Paenibacillus hamazuiensis]